MQEHMHSPAHIDQTTLLLKDLRRHPQGNFQYICLSCGLQLMVDFITAWCITRHRNRQHKQKHKHMDMYRNRQHKRNKHTDIYLNVYMNINIHINMITTTYFSQIPGGYLDHLLDYIGQMHTSKTENSRCPYKCIRRHASVNPQAHGDPLLQKLIIYDHRCLTSISPSPPDSLPMSPDMSS